MTTKDPIIEILLIENNPADAEFMATTLKQNYLGANLLHVKSANDALDFLQCAEILPNLILVDLNLPDMDGISLIRKIRLNQQTKEIAIVILTDSFEERNVIESHLLSVSAYFTKPINNMKLKRIVSLIQKSH